MLREMDMGDMVAFRELGVLFVFCGWGILRSWAGLGWDGMGFE